VAKVSWELPTNLSGMAVKQVGKDVVCVAFPITGKAKSKSGKTVIAFSTGGFRPLGETDMSISINVTKR